MVAIQNYYSQTLIIWGTKLKKKMLMKILVKIKKCLILAIIVLSQNIMIGWNKLVVGKMKEETTGFSIKEFVGLKTRMYSFLLDDISERKKQRVWIKMLMQQ